MRKFVLATLSLLVVVALIGIPAGWYFTGYTPSQLEQLERDWAKVEGWADIPALETAQDSVIEALLKDVESVEFDEDLFNLEEGERIARADLAPDVAALLERMETGLAEGQLGAPSGMPSAMRLLQLGQLEVHLDDMNAQRMGQFLAWTRTLHGTGPLIQQMVGMVLATHALERCQEDPSLIPTDADLQAPTMDEAFYGLCRDYVLLDSMQFDAGEQVARLSMDVESELLHQVMRRAMANNALRFYPHRAERQGPQPPPVQKLPGEFQAWLASTFGDAEQVTAYLESFLATTRVRENWVTFVDLWGEVLGA